MLREMSGRIRSLVPARARRFARELESALRDAKRRTAAQGARPLPDRYFIKAGYRHRESPRYDEQTEIGANWQASVYEEAVRLAEELDLKRIVDVGCGDGRKLATLHSRFAVVGLDYGPNLELCRARYAFGTWIEHDLEQKGTLPLDGALLRDAVVVCADVIEHLVRPEILLGKLAAALESAPLLLLSTPDRDLVRGPAHLGPPPNESHVREWSLDEFASLLVASGLRDGTVRHIRSNDVSPERHTILATLWGRRN